ncbi:MAG: gluconate 2-dehydrogenase subunit 3 family protein [Blastocatellia bacterium]|nr:gluconate 2-dehydrogenase subunit 3 family protein [Blastocatellia bacterium]
MKRREFIHLLLGSLSLSFFSSQLLASHASGKEFTETIAALSETILPANNNSPGTNGQEVVRMIMAKTVESQDWKNFYQKGTYLLNNFSRRMFRKPFFRLSPRQRKKCLAIYWRKSAGKPQEVFLQAIKQDAVTELFTTRAGLEWLGYKGKKEA